MLRSKICNLHTSMNILSDLSLDSTINIQSKCVSVAHGEQHLYVGCKDGRKYYDRNHPPIFQGEEDVGFKYPEVGEHNGELFVLTSKANIRTVMQLKNKEWGECFNFPQKTMGFLGFSVSEDYIACTDKDVKAIRLYDRQPGSRVPQRMYMTPYEMIYNLHFTPEGTLLATVRKTEHTWYLCSSSIRRDDTIVEMQTNWMCSLPDQCSGITSSANRIIFVGGICNKTIYIIRPEGLYISTCVLL